MADPRVMRLLHTAALLVPLLLAPGCFVIDEIDAGMEIMEAHTPAENKKKQAAATAPDGEPKPTYDQLVGEWWKDATTLSSEPSAEAAEDPLVPCQHGGKSTYTRRSDCLARGGQPG